MSTKIYYGFYIDVADVSVAQALITASQPALSEVASQTFSKVFSALYFNYLDNVYDELDDTSLAVFSMLEQDAAAALEDLQAGRRSPDFDYGLDVCLKAHEGKVYGYPFCESNPLRNAFMELPFVHEYGYWNNSDEPEDMSEDEWAERAAVWDNLLPRGSWIDCGFTPFDVLSAHSMIQGYGFDTLDLAFWDEDKRAERYAQFRAASTLSNQLYKETGECRPSQYMHFMTEVREGVHEKLVEQLRAEFMKRYQAVTHGNFKTLSPLN